MRIGILGDGQLGRLLEAAALRAGHTVEVLASGFLTDEIPLSRVAARSELLLFENEWLDCELLRRVQSRARVVPSLEALAILQNKLSQKRLYDKLGLPSAPFEVGAATSGQVLKWSMRGYDGKGVLLPEASASQREDFVKAARDQGVEIYSEARVDFVRELALVAVRDGAGRVHAYPLVISEQRGGICHRVYGPAGAWGVPAAFEHEARAMAQKLGDALDYVGVWAMEFFETRSGELWINEAAPRVHNSGHVTMDAFGVSQFDLHIAAATGAALPQILPRRGHESAGQYLMLNLLGPSGSEVAEPVPPQVKSGAHVHWYGKSPLRPGRKMGHVNWVWNDPKDRDRIWAESRMVEEQWLAANIAR